MLEKPSLVMTFPHVLVSSFMVWNWSLGHHQRHSTSQACCRTHTADLCPTREKPFSNQSCSIENSLGFNIFLKGVSTCRVQGWASNAGLSITAVFSSQGWYSRRINVSSAAFDPSLFPFKINKILQMLQKCREEQSSHCSLTTMTTKMFLFFWRRRWVRKHSFDKTKCDLCPDVSWHILLWKITRDKS